MDFAAHIQLLTGVSLAGSSKEESVLRAWTRFGFIRSISVHGLLIDHHEYQSKRTRSRYTSSLSSKYAADFFCPDDNYYDEDSQEVETVPPHSVLDIYRQEAITGHLGSRGPNVLDRLAS